MCSILGVSFAPESTINRRKLASALLTFGEVRGRDASGFAFVRPDGSDGLYKKDVPGSKLHVGALPQDATAMILHTRASTHGDPSDNENNHPVVSPSGRTRLVHNGVIYNHAEIRALLGKTGKGLPDVDSSVMPALFEEWGVDSSDQLSGYASAAWFDRETGDTIHLARFKTSTVFFATLWDGSMAFASTVDILGRSLNKLDIPWWGNYPNVFDSMSEGDYYQIMGGEVITESEVEWKKTSTYSGPDWSAQTSGGASKMGASGSSYTVPHPAATPRYEGGTVSKTTSVPTPPPGTTGKGFLRSEKDGEKSLVVINHGTGEVDDFDDVTTADLVGTGVDNRDLLAMVFAEGNPLDLSEADFETWVSTHPTPPDYSDDPDMPDIEEFFESNTEELFYTEGHDGDYVTYTSLSTLVQKLSWEAGLTSSENNLVGPEEGNLRWVNQIGDIGSLGAGGSEVYSWVKSEGDFQTVAHLVPSWVGEGVSKLRSLVGA